MVDVPAEIAAKTPVVEPIVPVAVLLLVHVPPETRSFKAVVEPAHKAVVPVIADGAVFIVTFFETMHPVPKE